MLADAIESPGTLSPDELLQRYEAKLADVIEAVGKATVRDRTGLDADVIDDVASGDAADLEVRDAAEILAIEGGTDADSIRAQIRERLMLEMSGAATDVDAVAVELDTDLDAKEIQAKIEGRLPMTLREYAHIHQHVAAAADW